MGAHRLSLDVALVDEIDEFEERADGPSSLNGASSGGSSAGLGARFLAAVALVAVGIAIARSRSKRG